MSDGVVQSNGWLWVGKMLCRGGDVVDRTYNYCNGSDRTIASIYEKDIKYNTTSEQAGR